MILDSENRSPVQIMVRAFLIILYFTARNSSYYSFMVDTSKAKCEKKCGSSNFCKINFVYLLLDSADRVQTKLNLQSLSYVSPQFNQI